MISRIVYILTLIGMSFAVYFFVDHQYAKCADVKTIERRLDYKIESDKSVAMQDRLWKLEDRYGSDPEKVGDKTIGQHMKELKVDLESQKGRVKSLENK
jgi:hypothetical protein